MDALSREIARFTAFGPQPWVWVLPLARMPAGAMQVFDGILGAQERNRAVAFRFARDASAYAAAHALLRWSLSLRHGCAPGAWKFEADAFGRPLLLKPAGWDPRFSLSHTEGLVAVALVEGFDVGVDAEALDAARDLPEIAEETFTSYEREQLGAAAAGFSSETERFYALWTLKEALLKAKGLGLNQHPHSFSIDLRSMSVAVPAALQPAHGWRLECRKPTAEHVVSLALDAPPEMRKAVFSVIEDVPSWLAHCEAMRQKAHR